MHSRESSLMASRTMSLGTHEIDFLKETLHGQQELLQKLYNELDVERESSATAADEALSMILRLQGEKAAMEMEASQYKRIAEEKMCHAQETLEIFQELIYNKEMQIASLEFQVQAYKFKLVSMGCDDLGASEMQYPENMLSRRVSGETSGQSSLRRGSSLPPPLLDAMSRRASNEGAKSSNSSPKMLKDVRDAESSIKREKDNGNAADFNTYWEEIRKLDERVKELANIKGFNEVSDSCSMRDPSPDNSPGKSESADCAEKVVSVQACGDSPCSTIVQDIFEVPQCSDHKKEKCKTSTEDEGRNGKLDAMWDDIWKLDVKEKIDWEKKPLLSPSSNNESPQPKDVREKNDLERRPLLSPGSNKLKDGKSGERERQSLFKHPTYGVADFELKQFNRRLKQLEDERFVNRGHEINMEAGDEELRLLREIREKVNSMQAEMASWKVKKTPQQVDHSVGCLREVMLCFWP